MSMDADVVAELDSLRCLIGAAALAGAERHTALWCLNQLPRLYRELERTCESRYADEVAGLVAGACKALGGAPGLAGELANRLRALHARLGLPGISLKVPAAPKRPPRKAS
jgi:hypothetical protein